MVHSTLMFNNGAVDLIIFFNVFEAGRGDDLFLNANVRQNN